MNPQEQPNVPNNDNDLGTAAPGNAPVSPVSAEPSNPEADSAAMQTIGALESEETAPAETPAPEAVQPVPSASPVSDPVAAPASTDQTASSSTPLDASAAGVTAAAGAQVAAAAQTPASGQVVPASEKKKSNKLLVVVLVVVLVLVAVAAGYFVWQSLQS